MKEWQLSELGLTTAELWADELDVTVRAVQKWIARGWVAAARVGKGKRVTYLLKISDTKGFTPPKPGPKPGPKREAGKPRVKKK